MKLALRIGLQFDFEMKVSFAVPVQSCAMVVECHPDAVSEESVWCGRVSSTAVGFRELAAAVQKVSRSGGLFKDRLDAAGLFRDLTSREGFPFSNAVSPPEFEGIESQGSGDFVKMRFARERGLRRAKATKRTARRIVRRQGLAHDLNLLTTIRSDQMQHGTLQNKRTERAVCASIQEQFGLQSDQLPGPRPAGLQTDA